jgi:Flp pilus assembly pilin Flp
VDSVRWIALRVWASERGQDLIEYALLGGFLAMVLMAVTFTGIASGLISFASEMGECVDFNASTNCG